MAAYFVCTMSIHDRETERMVIIAFPDKAAAKDRYNSADYQSASAFRRAASTGRMILQEGRANAADPDPKI